METRSKNKEEEVAALYDEVATTYAEAVKQTNYIGPQWLLDNLSERAKFEPLTLLDLGCANGINTLNLKQINPEIEAVGLDISSQMVAAARVCGAFEQVFEQTLDKPFPFDDASFDLIVVLGCLEFVNDLDAVLDEISRVARSNAELYASFQHHDPERTSAPRRSRSGVVIHHAYLEEEVSVKLKSRDWSIKKSEILIGYTGGYPCPYHFVTAGKQQTN